MATVEPIHARQAALLLHGLPMAARRQVIARLDPSERVRLSPLLAELSELGLPQSLGNQLRDVTWMTPPAGSSHTAVELTVQERVERLPAQDVIRCLRDCAPATVAQLLRVHAWPWKTEVLAGMSQPMRTKVLECIGNESPALAPAVLASLCAQLCLLASHSQPAGAQAEEASLGQPGGKRTLSIVKGLGAFVRRLIQWMR